MASISNVNNSITKFPKIVQINQAPNVNVQFKPIDAPTEAELRTIADGLKQKIAELKRSSSAALPENSNKNNRDPSSSLSPQQPFDLSDMASYDLTGFLGEGGYGAVYKATRKSPPSPSTESNKSTPSPTSVAMKVFPKEYGNSADREVTMLKATLGCQHVLQLKGFGTDANREKFFITTELLHPLKVDAYDLAMVREVATGLFKGVAEIHERGIVHGDLKPENCLMNNQNEGIIADLGAARFINKDRPQFGRTQSLWYSDPKHLINSPLSKGIDLWSLGGIVWALTMGKAMFPVDKSEPNLELLTMHMIERHLGPMPENIIRSGKAKEEYYVENQDGSHSLKPINAKQYSEHVPSRTRIEALRSKCLNAGCSETVIGYLEQLISQLVTYNKKISAQQALESPFFTNTAAFRIAPSLAQPLTKVEICDKTKTLATIALPITKPEQVLCPKTANNRYTFRFYIGEQLGGNITIQKPLPDRITNITSKILSKASQQAA